MIHEWRDSAIANFLGNTGRLESSVIATALVILSAEVVIDDLAGRRCTRPALTATADADQAPDERAAPCRIATHDPWENPRQR
jgi:hypothetical protein